MATTHRFSVFRILASPPFSMEHGVNEKKIAVRTATCAVGCMESGSPSKSWGRPAASHSDRSLKRILCGEGWAVASSPNVVNPGGGCPRLWFLGSPVLNFAWEFLYEVSSHQKDTCAKQEGNRAFFFFAWCSSQARCHMWREVSLPMGSQIQLYQGAKSLLAI